MRGLVSWLAQPRQKLLVSIGWVDMGYEDLNDHDTRLPGVVENESIICVVHFHDEKLFSRSKSSMPVGSRKQPPRNRQKQSPTHWACRSPEVSRTYSVYAARSSVRLDYNFISDCHKCSFTMDLITQ